MISTEKDKAFVKICVPYYRLWTTESYEIIPWQRRNTFGLDNLITKLLKKGDVQAHAWSSISPTVRKPNERRDRRFGVKLVCW